MHAAKSAPMIRAATLVLSPSAAQAPEDELYLDMVDEVLDVQHMRSVHGHRGCAARGVETGTSSAD